MWNKTATVLLSTCLLTSGCSSFSLPSMPWSGSSAQSDPTAEALFEQGMRNFNDKKYVRAIDDFTRIKTDHPFSPLVPQAELKAADAQYLNGQYPEAINLFKEFESLHPASDQLPFVTLRLGQAYFDQFTGIDRDQKNTELAKGYFEAVITKYPKSPQAAIATEKLAEALGYLAEHEFAAAQFYFKEQKYAAARDRFEEIVRKYRDTPTAVKSLYFLGESYRLEKNGPRAMLAYEALIQRYPQSKYAADAQIQLGQLGKEKIDPLDLLLMRDRRPGGVAAPVVKEDPALAKLKDLNLVAKKEVVFEEPGAEKGFFRRLTDKINPFSSSGSNEAQPQAGEAQAKSVETKPKTGLDLIAEKNEASKKESGFFSSLWPFGSKDTKTSVVAADPAKTSGLVANIDQSLNQKGIDAKSQKAALKAPAADLPKPESTGPPSMDPGVLLGSIDANLKKSGTDPTQTPAPPAAAAAFTDRTLVESAVAKAGGTNQQPSSAPVSGILSSIDAKLQAQGVEPAKFTAPPTPEQVKEATAPKAQPKTVELKPNLAVEKGPLFLSPSDAPLITTTTQTADNPPPAAEKEQIASRTLVKGPVQPQAAAANAKSATTQKNSGVVVEEGNPSVFGQIQQDLEKASKILNPFSW